MSVLSEKAGFFKPMVDRSARGVARVYEHAEVLFARLGEEQKKLVDWVALGTVDLEDFCMKHLDEVADWETNIRMLKEATRAAEKLPLEVKVRSATCALRPPHRPRGPPEAPFWINRSSRRHVWLRTTWPDSGRPAAKKARHALCRTL